MGDGWMMLSETAGTQAIAEFDKLRPLGGAEGRDRPRFAPIWTSTVRHRKGLARGNQLLEKAGVTTSRCTTPSAIPPQALAGRA